MARKPVRALRARSSFAVGGVGRVYEGDLLRSDDPLVVGREQLFDVVDDVLGIVEQATSNPGQKRVAKKPSEPAEEAGEPEEGSCHIHYQPSR